MITIACYTPNFMPWTGFFYKVIRADIFVLLDNVQFPLGISWVNRNRIKNKNGTFWLTVPVWKKGRRKQRIKDVEIFNEKNWQKKHYLSLINTYKNAPYLSVHLDFFHEIYHHHWKGLLDLNMAIIRYFLKALGIQKEVILSSSLNVTAKGQELLIQICKKLDAGCYVSLSTGRKYIDEGLFQREKIRIKFYSYRPVVYPQLWGDFKPNLSAIDLLLNCGGNMALAMLGRESYGKGICLA